MELYTCSMGQHCQTCRFVSSPSRQRGGTRTAVEILRDAEPREWVPRAYGPACGTRCCNERIKDKTTHLYYLPGNS